MEIDAMKDLIDELDSVLDKERDAVLGGDLELLDRLLVNKTRLVEQVNKQARPETAELPALRRKLMRNQALLNSAMQGVRNIADRLAELRTVREELRTYDARGKKNRYRTVHGATVEKRA
jgi:flagellar biosynthesis/type III secretory pathway chaperone